MNNSKNKLLLTVLLSLCSIFSSPVIADEHEEELHATPQMSVGELFNGIGDIFNPETAEDAATTTQADQPPEPQGDASQPDDLQEPSAAVDGAEEETGNGLVEGIGGLFKGIGSALQGDSSEEPENNTRSESTPTIRQVEQEPPATSIEEDIWADFDDSKETHVDASQAYRSIRVQFMEKALNFHHGEAAALLLSNGADHRDVEKGDVYTVCETWLHVRHFSKLQSCMTAFEQQIIEDDSTEIGLLNASFRWNRAMGEFYLNRWRAIRALEYGDKINAINYGEAAREITDNGRIDLASDSLLGILSAPGDLLGDMVNAKRRAKGHYINSAIGYDVYGVLAVAYAQTGNEQGYQKNLQDLLAMVNDRYNVEYKTRYWLVLAYLAAKDYEAALRETKLREKDLLDGVDKVLTDYNPLVGIAGSLMGAGDISGYKKYGLLEYQYVKAHSLYKLGRTTEAMPLYDALLKAEGVASLGSVYFRALYDRATIAEQNNDAALALSLYAQAIEVVEQQRSTIATESGKLGFAGGQQKIYERMINLLLKQGKYGEAFEYVERAKARALVDMLASRKKFSGGKATAQAASYLKQLDKLDQQELIIAKDQAQGTKLRSAAVAVKTDLKRDYPELASLVTVDTDSVESISSRLAADEQLLEYYQQDETLYAFLLDRSGIKAFVLKGQGLRDEISEFRRAIRNESPQHRVLSQRLYHRLIAPMARDLNKPNLLIVPHGPLHYLPFNALGDSKRYLIERHSIRLLPSASVLRFLNKGETAGNSELLVLGNPDIGDARMNLPGAESEAKQLARIWSSSEVLLRRQASETAVRVAGERFSHLHFASHGQFDAADPLNSRLLLAGDERNDGNLTVGEMYELRLNADMVTLSACETGLGKVSSGDDVVGLTRGFLYAGAKSIVASLWEVADEPTAYIMVEFYKNLKHNNKAAALRQAQLATRKKYSHPLYWAAFQLTGSAL